jgi:hypothetical protein
VRGEFARLESAREALYVSSPLPSDPPRRWAVALAPALGVSVLALAAHARFTDATAEAGLLYQQMESITSNFSTHLQSGGAAAGDFDGDGWVDLFVTRVGARDILFRNLGPGADGVVRFADVTEEAGITGVFHSNGAAWVDVDNDGDLDLYVTTLYHNRFYLYINNGDGTFREEAIRRSADLLSSVSHNGFSVAVGDYDRDGFLDLYVCEWDIRKNVRDLTLHNSLLRNLGAPAPGFFSNRTLAAGVSLKGVDLAPDPNFQYLFAFTARFSDLDGDGWPDLLITADYGSSQLFWNNGNGTFTDEGAGTGIGLEGNGMGSDVGDFDGDGRLDWFVTSIDDNRLYRNLGNRRFEEVARTVGPAPGPGEPPDWGLTFAGWGWGTAFLDFDNDGDLDLVMTNGHEDRENLYAVIESVDQTTFWRNDEGVYVRVSDELGLTDKEPGKGLLVFDYDRDGDLDIFIVNCQTTPILYRNDTINDHRWSRIDLVGRRSNSFGVGARLELQVEDGGPVQIREVSGGSNYLGQNELTAHFGLGPDVASIHALTVRWPSGVVQTLHRLPVDRQLRVVEPATYQEWQTRLSPRTLPSLGGKWDDFDGDGMPNFLEYLFATNPRDPRAVADPRRLRPALRRGSEGDVLRYARPVGALDGGFVYEASQDLDTWVAIGHSGEGGEVPVASEGDFTWVEVALPPDASGARFVRVRPVESVE